MAVEGSLPPVIQWPGSQTLCCPFQHGLLCLQNDQKASFPNFPQDGNSTAEFVHQLRPAWWLSSVLMQMRLHVELVLGV